MLCAQRERHFRIAFLSQQVEQVPLRHHRDVGMAQWQASQVGDPHPLPVRGGEGDVLHMGLGQRFEALEQTQVVQHGQGGGVDGVATKIA